MHSPPLMIALVDWFEASGGLLDKTTVDFRDDPCLGRSVYALRDVPKGHVLFKIPRDLLLSVRTCALKKELGESAWSTLGTGWASLILCMMWEESKGTRGKWKEYLDILPKTFSTPMFWTDDELKELKGTSIYDKIGKEEADADYHNRVVPLLESRRDLFPVYLQPTFFTVENYHRLGSSILSRSFHVEEWNSEEQGTPSEVGDESEEANGGSDDEPGASRPNEAEDMMDLDGPSSGFTAASCAQEEKGQDKEKLEEGDTDSDDEQATADIAMVPMADMLNARYGCDNARLFYEPTFVAMITTKDIKTGEEIWNTYGDLPNSDLLRRYGHVDVVCLPQSSANGSSGTGTLWGTVSKGNPADIVEIKAILAVDAFIKLQPSERKQKAQELAKERIDWWLEQGGDDTFVMEFSHDVLQVSPPEGLVSIIRLLLLTNAEWNKLSGKRNPKPPKSKIESVEVANMVIDVLHMRLGEYETSLEHDISLLPPSLTDSISIPASAGPALSLNKMNAVVVRIGEKRVLHLALLHAQERLVRLQSSTSEVPRQQDRANGSNKKRKERKSEDGVPIIDQKKTRR